MPPVSSCVSFFCVFLSGILTSSPTSPLVSPLTSSYVLHRGTGATLTRHLPISKKPPSRIMTELWQYACFPATLPIAVHLHRAIHLCGSHSSTSHQRKKSILESIKPKQYTASGAIVRYIKNRSSPQHLLTKFFQPQKPFYAETVEKLF